MSAGKPMARLALARRVRVTLDLPEVDHAMLTALCRHLNRTPDEVVVDALRDFFVAVPRPGDPR